MGAAVAGFVGVVAGIAGLALGRLVPKHDPVGVVCGTCDGPSRVRWDVIPGWAPANCPDCGRAVRAPGVLLVGSVAIGVVVLRLLDGRDALVPANALLGCSLAALTWTDLRYRVLPARLVWLAVLASLPALALADRDEPDARLPAAVVVALAAGGVFLVLHLLSPDGLGLGDVRLAVLLGLHLGWRSPGTAYWGLFLAVLMGAALGQVLKRTRGVHTLPFGPYLAVATGVALVTASAVGW